MQERDITGTSRSDTAAREAGGATIVPFPAGRRRGPAGPHRPGPDLPPRPGPDGHDDGPSAA